MPTKPRILTPAAAYIRMSGDKQERSPGQQRGELAKLAEQHGCRIIREFIDEAICGDSGADARPGLAALLRGVQAGEFKVVLAWHTNRLSRQDPMDAIALYNVLRKAGVGLVTCCEGRIDLQDFAKQLLLFVNQKASNDYCLELSQKILRGQVHNARDGFCNGGPPRFALERVLVDAGGNVVRRLAAGETVRMPGHRVRLVPSGDKAKLAAVMFAFQRFASADVSIRQLARELSVKGLPSPRGRGWQVGNVAALLRNPSYCGSVRWGARTMARYFCPRGSDIAPAANGNGKGCHAKPAEDSILAMGAHEGIVSVKLFDAVQRRLARRYKRRGTARAAYPLSGLIFCSHCGRALDGCTVERHGGQYRYQKYICQTCARGLDRKSAGCGHYTIDAAAVQQWLVRVLQAAFLGPGRDKLVSSLRRQLRSQTKRSGDDNARLVKRLPELDMEIGRLADEVWSLGQALTDAEPAVLRELCRRLVSRIDCQWTRRTTQAGRQRCELIGGTVELRGGSLFDSLLGGASYAEA